MSVDDYRALIPPGNSTKPKFVATVQAAVACFALAQAVTVGLVEDFDLDSAVGAQLDVVGQWVGQSRFIPTPIAGLYFSLDIPALGLDRGIIKGPFDTDTGISRLDDDTYRRLLRAKILANSWDGTAEGAQAILDVYFIDPTTHVFVQDDGQTIIQENYFSLDDPLRGLDLGYLTNSTTLAASPAVDMAMTVGVSGTQPSILDLAILSLNLIPVKPTGVNLTYAVTSVDGAPLFGLDTENEFVSGLDVGATGVAPDDVVALAS